MSLHRSSTSSNDAPEPLNRLLEAWRGEVEAKAVYEALAHRERDPDRAAVLRRPAEAESGHRTRIEARLRELGVAPPDPASVHLSPWTKLQIRLAPVDKVLAWRERLETSESDDVYKRPTGDGSTDGLFAHIRIDEKSHALAVKEMRWNGSGDAAFESPEGRLRRILGHETWHRRGSNWISGAVYGANDCLGAVFGIVTGVSGATGGSSFVLTAGLAGVIASAISMAVGAHLAERSASEVALANVEGERTEVKEHREEEKQELSLFYQLKGFSEAEADEADKLARNPEVMLKTLVSEELGTTGDSAGNTVQAAIAAGLSTGVGAFIPVIPFFFLNGTAAVLWATAVSLIAHFAVGAAKSLFTLRSWWTSGAGDDSSRVIVGGVTYLLGLLFKVST